VIKRDNPMNPSRQIGNNDVAMARESCFDSVTISLNPKQPEVLPRVRNIRSVTSDLQIVPNTIPISSQHVSKQREAFFAGVSSTFYHNDPGTVQCRYKFQFSVDETECQCALLGVKFQWVTPVRVF
jgi:hypothetical protein